VHHSQWTFLTRTKKRLAMHAQCFYSYLTRSPLHRRAYNKQIIWSLRRSSRRETESTGQFYAHLYCSYQHRCCGFEHYVGHFHSLGSLSCDRSIVSSESVSAISLPLSNVSIFTFPYVYPVTVYVFFLL
jgi:hypothetical protein